MSETATNQLWREHLKAIQSNLSSMADDIADLQSVMRGVKSHRAGRLYSEVAQDGAVASLQARPDWPQRRQELPD